MTLKNHFLPLLPPPPPPPLPLPPPPPPLLPPPPLPLHHLELAFLSSSQMKLIIIIYLNHKLRAKNILFLEDFFPLAVYKINNK